MASRKIVRCRSAGGQLALYNPHTVPLEVAQELEGIYGFQPREASGCLADVMISQRKGEFPPVAFMMISKDAPGFSIESTLDRLMKAEKAFANVFAVAVLPIPRYSELQLLCIGNSVKMKLFAAFSISAAAKLMVSIHKKLAFQVSKKADQLNIQMNNQLLQREHAMAILQVNFPFLSTDECDMLLDIFGSIKSIALASAAEILDVTVLSTDAAQRIEAFFREEYVVD